MILSNKQLLKLTLIALLLPVNVALGYSQNTPSDTLVQTIEDEVVQHDLDSLVQAWQASTMNNSLMVIDSVSTDSINHYVTTPDSIYIKRLGQIVSPIPFPYNNAVRTHIEFYTQKRRDRVESMLGLADYYFPIFESALDANDMPLELKYMAVIESALNPKARSRVGAAGLWQFMYGTGKMYGLEVNSYVDERYDPVKSTQSAVRYLKDLYSIYGDWHLVIAAYNCGPGNVNRAIKRSGGKRDFWKIYYYLPRETRNYVPAFIAAAYTFNYYIEHNLYPRTTLLPVSTDTIMIYKPLHFEQVAQALNCQVDLLRSLNPQYKCDVVPAIKKAYPLKLAFGQATEFAANEDSIYAKNRDKYFAQGELMLKPTREVYEPEIPKDKAKIYYTVKEGDAIGLIADWFDVYINDLRYWNNINRNMIRVGQKLVVYVPKNKIDYYQNINNLTYEQKQGTSSTTASTSVKTNSTQPEDPNYIYYTVRSGDNLWNIAQKYPGVTNKDIMALNNITDARKISIGQKLKIKKKS